MQLDDELSEPMADLIDGSTQKDLCERNAAIGCEEARGLERLTPYFGLGMLTRTLTDVSDALPEAIFITNETGLVVAANAAAESLIGAEPGALAGRRIGELLVFSFDQGSRRYTDLLQCAPEHDRNVSRDGTAVTNFQEKKHSIDFSVTPLTDDASELIGGILIARHLA